MLEDWEEFTSLILMTKITKKLSKIRKTYGSDHAVHKESSKWHHEGGCEAGSCIPKDSKKRFMAEKWNLMNPQGKEWNLYLQNTKTTLQAKDLLRCRITILCTNLFLCLKQWRFWMQKNALDKEWNKPETIPAWVFRGDTVKDDSGAFAVFTEQRLVRVQNDGRKSNGCYCLTTRLWRTSSWRNIGVHPGKKRRMLENYSKFPNQNVRMYGSVFQNMNGRSHGNTLKIPLFLLNETYTDTHLRDSCGKDSSKKC